MNSDYDIGCLSKIIMIVRDREPTQRQTAKLLGVDQPKVSALMRGRSLRLLTGVKIAVA
jgi:predicted XRE-type DNA-binding protein